MLKPKQSAIEFWRLKQAIDDQVKRLGWSTDQCIDYCQKHYKVRSRLLMTDKQLQDMLKTLTGLSVGQTTGEKLSRRKGKKRRR